jgi:hypothetical protein
LKRELGVDASLSKGSGGIFEVAVNGKTVASKGLAGFPAEAEIVEAVRRAL